jgi:hypothetical protein
MTPGSGRTGRAEHRAASQAATEPAWSRTKETP